MKKLLIALLSIVAAPAFGQSLPSPRYQDVTINGSLIFKPCTGYLYAGADGSTTCVTANGLAPDTPSLSGANSWLSPQTFGSNGAVTGEARFANGAGTGASVVVRNNAAEAAYYFNLPSTAGTDGYVLTSGGGGTEPMRWSPLAAVAASGSASDLVSGTLAAARGGAGNINGALKGNGSGVVSKAACADLSNAAASCSTDTTNADNISSGALPAARLAPYWPGLTTNNQGTGSPGVVNGPWMSWNPITTYSVLSNFRADRYVDSDSAGGSTIAGGFRAFGGTNPTNQGLEWNFIGSFYNSTRPYPLASPSTTLSQNGSGFFTSNKVRSTDRTTSITGDGSTVTVAYQAGASSRSPVTFPVGSKINIQGATPDINGTKTVTASSRGSVSFAGSETGPQTVAGTIGYATTGASGDGATATVTFSGGETWRVGDTVVIAGVSPSGYNGKHVITAASAGSVSFASTETGAYSSDGQIRMISVGTTWGAYAGCEDYTGVDNPLGRAGCHGLEVDAIVKSPDGDVTTDTNISRVALLVAGRSLQIGSHIGAGITISTDGAIMDKGIRFNNADPGGVPTSYETGIDTAGVNFSNAALRLGDSQKIIFDASDTRFIRVASGTFVYGTSIGNVFQITNDGDASLPFGALTARRFVSSGTTPTIGGTCATDTKVGGSAAGAFKINNAAGCAAGTTISLTLTAAPTGYHCNATNMTTPASLIEQTGYTTTSATFTVRGTTAGDDDDIAFSCIGF